MSANSDDEPMAGQGMKPEAPPSYNASDDDDDDEPIALEIMPKKGYFSKIWTFDELEKKYGKKLQALLKKKAQEEETTPKKRGLLLASKNRPGSAKSPRTVSTKKSHVVPPWSFDGTADETEVATWLKKAQNYWKQLRATKKRSSDNLLLGGDDDAFEAPQQKVGVGALLS